VLLRLLWQIRRYRPEVLVYLMPPRPIKNVRRDRVFFHLAGVRRFFGLPGEKEIKCRFDASTGLYEAEAFRLARTIKALGDAHPEDLANWNLQLNAAENEAADRALSPLPRAPLIVCAPGSKMQANEWGQENWRALLGQIYLKFPAHTLVLSGAKEDRPLCEFAGLDWAGAKLNLAGMLCPRESAAVFSRATLFIGPDSGPKHLAASTGVPCVCVFAARDLPGVWFPPGNRNVIVYHRPECSGCLLETCIEMDRKCIRSVTVDEMVRAVASVLGREVRA
jgi:ADP-heptose:LPS heptosyltransferase